jgi:hypothetical protein
MAVPPPGSTERDKNVSALIHAQHHGAMRGGAKRQLRTASS